MDLKKEYFTHLAVFLVVTPIVTAISWYLTGVPPVATVIGYFVMLTAVSFVYYRGIKTVYEDMKESSEGSD